MAAAMKSWYVEVLEKPCKRVFSIKCATAQEATLKLDEAKKQFPQ